MQQKIVHYSFYIIPLLVITSCRKTDIAPSSSASLTIINAVAGTNSLVNNFGGTDPLSAFYINAKQIYYNSFQPAYQYSSYSGKQVLALYNYPDTLPKSIPLFNFSLDIPIGSINSLFLTGTVESPDNLLVKDNPVYFPASDSSMGIRFVNLSPGSAPVSVNIQGQANGTEINNLEYKSISEFKKYPATAAVASYTFEFRDMATGTLLGTFLAEGINSDGSDPWFPVNRWRYRNYTLALLGLPEGTGSIPQTILLINNY